MYFKISSLFALAGLMAIAPIPAGAYVHRYGAHWYHGTHQGHVGWWWINGGNWYFYTRPVYPYPAPPFIVQPPVASAVQPAAPSMTPPMPTVPPGYTAGAYYYCGNPRGYYPYVPNCLGGWTAVPVNPAN